MTAGLPQKTAIVAGGSGVVGWRLAHHLASLGGWRVIALCRRPVLRPAPFEILHVDLTQRDSCTRALGQLKDITHIFYAGRYDHVTTAPEPIEINVAMLRNLVETIGPDSPSLRHIHLLQGMKVYGATLGPYKTPAKETDARVRVHTFYYAQQDYVSDLQRGKSWTWSASRPQGVCDPDPSIGRSMAKLIAVYATIAREENLPMSFPGSTANFNAIYQVTDSTQLAKAIAWMSTAPQCANQAFNVTNGDYFRWANLWPAFADYFFAAAGAPKKINLAEVMPGKTSVWRSIVQRHQLAQLDYQSLVVWPYGNFIFGTEFDQMSDLTKLRTHGFNEVVDTEKMFLTMFDQFRRERIIS